MHGSEGGFLEESVDLESEGGGEDADVVHGGFVEDVERVGGSEGEVEDDGCAGCY